MELRGGLTLATRSTRALLQIAADRCDEALGGALPRSAEALARPEVIDALVARYTPKGVDPLPPVAAVSLPGVEFESSNCKNFLLDLELGGDAAGTRRSVYAKLPCDELTTRVFANAIGFWGLECSVAERVAPHVPVRVPRVYVVAQRGARFVLLLENLRELAGARLFDNRDMAAGTTPERARMCLTAFAELHATFWGWSAARREALLPTALHTYLSPDLRAMTRALNVASIAPAHRAAPDLFGPEQVALCRRATASWDALVEAWYREPLTLIHGDSHLANCFEYATEDGPRMGLLDFQASQWCKGMRDVQYFLINSLDPDVLAAHEEALIDHYLSELAGRGVELDPEEARIQYRAFSFQTLMVGVVSLGLGSLTERDATVRTVLARGIAAVERLRFGDWLGEVEASSRSTRPNEGAES